MRFHRILLMSLIQKATTSCALIRSLRSNDATTTRTSLKKWICVLSVLIAIVPTHLLGHPSSSKGEITFRRCLFTFYIKHEIRRTVVVLLIKPIFYVLVAVASLDLEVLNELHCNLMSFLRKKGV